MLEFLGHDLIMVIHLGPAILAFGRNSWDCTGWAGLGWVGLYIRHIIFVFRSDNDGRRATDGGGKVEVWLRRSCNQWSHPFTWLTTRTSTFAGSRLNYERLLNTQHRDARTPPLSLPLAQHSFHPAKTFPNSLNARMVRRIVSQSVLSGFELVFAITTPRSRLTKSCCPLIPDAINVWLLLSTVQNDRYQTLSNSASNNFFSAPAAKAACDPLSARCDVSEDWSTLRFLSTCWNPKMLWPG